MSNHPAEAMAQRSYKISCQCGAAAQTVIAAKAPWAAKFDSTDTGIEFCHCKTCRHTTGVLCSSYIPIIAPSSTQALKIYNSSPNVQRCFCATCGCHVFRHDDSDERSGWRVATGVISESVETSVGDYASRDPRDLRCTRHINVNTTIDGGLAPWIAGLTGSHSPSEYPRPQNSNNKEEEPEETLSTSPAASSSENLQAHCQCGTVRFHITRPDDSSRVPHSGLPDLIIPFRSEAPEIENKEDRKWWLRPEGAARPTHYMAGTCACKSCRLISGFEIQTWAFVPRSNIIFHLRADSEPRMNSDDAVGVELMALDFATLPTNILRSYESSPGVLRESCVQCGATVFWHDKWRPDLIDVSVGLLDAPEGARAEGWLEWWKDRVSFAEDVDNGRSGSIAQMAKDLLNGLEKGLGASR